MKVSKVVFILLVIFGLVFSLTSQSLAFVDRIAFSSSQDGNMEIYLTNVDGPNVVLLTNSPGLDIEPG